MDLRWITMDKRWEIWRCVLVRGGNQHHTHTSKDTSVRGRD